MIRKRRSTNGKIRYQAIAHKDGEKISLKTWSTLTEAKDAIRKFENTSATDPRLVSEWAQTWFELYPRPQDSTNYNNRIMLVPFLKTFGDRKMNSIGRAEARAWAINHRHNAKVVSAMFHNAIDAEVVDRNPFANLGIPRGRGRKDIVPLTEDQVQHLADSALVALDAFYGPVFRAGIIFHAYTGLRSGEFCGLEWEDLVGDELHVQRQVRADGSIGLPKQERKRRIIVPEIAQDALRSVSRKHPWMFPTVQGKRMARGSHLYAFNAVKRTAGLHEITPYWLRHTCGSLLADQGLTARDIAAQLGNSPEVCQSVYIHDYEDRVHDRLRMGFAGIGVKRDLDPREAAG